MNFILGFYLIYYVNWDVLDLKVGGGIRKGGFFNSSLGRFLLGKLGYVVVLFVGCFCSVCWD